MNESTNPCTLEDLKQIKTIVLDQSKFPHRVQLSCDASNTPTSFLQWPEPTSTTELKCHDEYDVVDLVLPFLNLLTGKVFQVVKDDRWGKKVWRRNDTL